MPALVVTGLIALIAAGLAGPAVAVPTWTSPNHFRVLLTVNPRGIVRKNSPASVDVDLPQALASLGSTGTFDESSIEVVAYDASGAPRVFDASRTGYERYLLPWRTQRYYGIGRVTMSFVVPDQTYTQYAVYFDTLQSGLGKPLRYPGLVGDGDFFREEYKRREIGACHMDSFADFDGDGDLDLFKGGVEPFINCYENVGGNRYVDRGRMTSGGSVFELPASGSHRSWVTFEFFDWDSDGDQDLFASFTDGPDAGYIVRYQNMQHETGQLTFVNRGRLLTQSGKTLGDTWFAAPKFVDWDGDGKKDVVVCRQAMIEFHKNLGPDNDITNIQLADGVYLTANGKPIRMGAPRLDCADLDGDGDLDLLIGTQDGAVFWFKNVGTRTNPVFTAGRIIAFYEFMDCYSAPKIWDFNGDGLLDFVVGRFWERTHHGEQPRMYGRLYLNIGTPTAPRFQAVDANGGCPYTEEFQPCDAVKQNGVRTVDWNNDGKPDLIASDTDGFVWFFRNLTGRLFPLFAAGEKILAGGKPIRVDAGSNWGGYARADVCDWNNDGKNDLLVADALSRLYLYLNQGTDANPVLAEGVRVYAGGSPIDGPGGRGSVLVCDWNNDGKKDVVLADDSGYYFYRNQGTDAAPNLVAGTPILFNGQTVTYNRPNLGSYIDWDGDGKKDFIAGEFESSVRFYKNIGSGGAGVVPQFADKDGVVIVLPYTIMLCSGADAKDWNNDGDLDILTGQGHGGSYLRLYERDYINDFVGNTFPTVSTGSSECGRGIAELRAMGTTGSVTVPRAIVTACFDTFFYIESADRVGGIRVDLAGHGRSEGDVVDVRGALTTNTAGERCITAPSVTVNGY